METMNESIDGAKRPAGLPLRGALFVFFFSTNQLQWKATNQAIDQREIGWLGGSAGVDLVGGYELPLL